SNTRKIERGRAVAGHTVRAKSEVVVVMNVRVGTALLHGESGAQQARCQRCDWQNGVFLVVQRCAFATRRCEKFVMNGIVDNPGQSCSMLCESNGDRKAGIFVSKVGGAVQRIDVPMKLRAADVARAFFGDDGGMGEKPRKALDNRSLAPTICLGDQIHVTLIVNIRRQRVLLAQY